MRERELTKMVHFYFKIVETERGRESERDRERQRKRASERGSE